MKRSALMLSCDSRRATILTFKTWQRTRGLRNCSIQIPCGAGFFRFHGRGRTGLAQQRTFLMETKAAEYAAREKTSRTGDLRVVAIGGGTGLSTLLKGLKRFVVTPAEILSGRQDAPVIGDLSAVVTVSDDGGSSGRLRKEFNMLPPGDIRNCIVALSEDEALLSKLFRHRFEKGSGLEGHSFGNLFLAALTSITSDFSEAVRLSSEILLTRGHIYPATTSNIELEALMEDGTRIRGETKITASNGRINELFLIPANVGP